MKSAARKRVPHRRPTRVFTATLLTTALVAAGTLIGPAAPSYANEATDKLVHDAGRKLREQDIAGALRLLEEAIATDPADATANVLYQETARNVLGLGDVKARYEKLATEHADDPLYQYYLVRLEEPEAALAAFDKLALKHKASPWPLIGRARALQLLERDAESIAALDAAVALDSSNVNIRAAQAFALERGGKFAEAADAWAQVLDARPDDQTARIGRGEALRRAGQGAAAITVLDEAAKAAPKDADPPYRIGLVHLDGKKYAEARAAFDRALGLDRSMVEALVGASEAILRNEVAKAKEGRKDIDDKALMKALGYTNRAVASNPDSAGAHFAHGAVYEALGEVDADHLDTALDSYGEALDLLPFPGPQRVRVLVARSFVLLRLASWDAAQTVAQQALDIDPDCVPAMIHAGHAMCQTGKFDEAISKYYKPGLKIAKDDPRLLYGSAMASWSLKKHNDAKKGLEKAVKLDPDNGLYHLSLGELYYELKKYKTAVQELFKATDLRPKDPIAWTAYGRACTSEGHWEDAIEAFEKSIELNEEALEEFLWIAIIYDKHLDDREKAREYLEKWEERGPEEDPNLESWIDDVFSDEEDGG